MGVEITCPRCGRPVLPQNRYCQHCGVDLAVAAVIEEQVIFPAESPTGLPMVPEILVPRMGEFMIQHDLLDRHRLSGKN